MWAFTQSFIQSSYHTKLTNRLTEAVAHDIIVLFFRLDDLLRKYIYKETLMQTMAAQGYGSEREQPDREGFKGYQLNTASEHKSQECISCLR